MALRAPRFARREAPREARTQGLRVGARHAAALTVSGIYLVASMLVAGGLHLPSTEAVSRTVHLSLLAAGPQPSALALGVDRPPLLSFLALPLALVPALRVHGLAAALATAALGGLAVLVAAGLARWASMGRATTVLYVTAFALHPLLVYSGAIGLPEALYAVVLLGAFGQFLRWLRVEATAPVVSAGAWMGLAFLLHYDSLWVVAAMAIAYYRVARARGGPVEGTDAAQATLAAFVTPVVFVAGLWALVCWFATGDPFAFIEAASRLSAFRGDEPEILRLMQGMRGNLPEVAAWFGHWTLAFGMPSAIAIAALGVLALARRRGEPLRLALVLASVALPETVALLAGHGQPRAPHLFALVVPAFVALAYAGSITSGEAVPVFTTRHRRHRVRLAAITLLLAIASLATAAAIPALPRTDPPGPLLLERALAGGPAEAPEDVRRVAVWLNEHAGAADVIADAERAAPVIMESGRYELFRTPLSTGGEAAAFDPYGQATYLLVRRPLEGAADDLIERAHPRLYSQGAAYATLAFEAGEYRVYRVESNR
ncbi:MAG: hypothetical protein WC273_06490 [Dehalococcoidia bacterium]